MSAIKVVINTEKHPEGRGRETGDKKKKKKEKRERILYITQSILLPNSCF
jgi:hypothetical protein